MATETPITIKGKGEFVPNWKFHDKWAGLMGIDRKVSLYVNVHENRIWRRSRKIISLSERLDSMRQKGQEYVRAWMLHVTLDWISDSPVDFDVFSDAVIYDLSSVRKALRFLKRHIPACPERDAVESFIKIHQMEILRDLPPRPGTGFKKTKVYENDKKVNILSRILFD